MSVSQVLERLSGSGWQCDKQAHWVNPAFEGVEVVELPNGVALCQEWHMVGTGPTPESLEDPLYEALERISIQQESDPINDRFLS